MASKEKFQPDWDKLEATRDSLREHMLMLNKRDEQIAMLREALEWYRDRAAGCRKLGRIGDDDRQALDRDGGKRAEHALAAAAQPEQDDYRLTEADAPYQKPVPPEQEADFAAALEQDGGWLPMDSAPRAWQSIMLHEPDAERNNEVGEGYFDGAESDPGVGENCWKWADGTQAFPTHWRPLPAPPTSTEAEGEG